MKPSRLFQYCPRCGQAAPRTDANPFHCDHCEFHYYFNPAAAAAAIVVRPDEHALFVRRAKEPALGRLALVGGFIDIDETAEKALLRETREEVGLELESFQFLCSHPNHYEYRGATYPVLDFFFVARVTGLSARPDPTEVDEVVWVSPLEIDARELAFPSQQFAVKTFQARSGKFPS